MKILHLAIITIFSILVLILGTFLYWNFEGILFHQITNVRMVNFKTTKETYTRNETVEATFNYCKFRDVSTTIQWSLIDTYERIYPAKTYSIQRIGCFENLNIVIEDLPSDVPNDTYHFSGTAVYRLNPIREIIIYLKTNNFEVK